MAVELFDIISKLPGAAPLRQDQDELWMDAPDIEVLAMARAMLEFGAVLKNIGAMGIAGGEAIILYHYLVDDKPLTIAAHTHGNAIISIAPVLRAAASFEREIHELFSVIFVDCSRPRRLFPPSDVHEDFFHE